MNDKQTKALEYLNDLESYAKKQQLSTRILDAIEDCRKQAVKEDVNWNALHTQVEDLFVSIGHKIGADLVQTDKNGNEVMVQEVKTQVTKMAERCHYENEESMHDMGERSRLVIKKMQEEMREISYSKAHLEELKNEELYLEFFQKKKQNYERDAIAILREMLENISRNYDYMLEHIKSMFRSIGGYKMGIGNEKFYYEYGERKEGISKKIQNEATTADMGGNAILTFGERTKDTIKQIVQKLEKKRKRRAWLPLLCILVLFCITAVTSYTENQEVIEQTETEISESDENAKLKESAMEWGKQLGEKAIQSVSLKAVGTFLSAVVTFLLVLVITAGAWLLLIILLLVLLYKAYLKLLRLWCDRQIRKKCGEYLKTELSSFEQENAVLPKLQTVMENAAAEYEQQYLEVWNQIFSKTQFAPDSAEESLASLKEKWNSIKYN